MIEEINKFLFKKFKKYIQDITKEPLKRKFEKKTFILTDIKLEYFNKDLIEFRCDFIENNRQNLKIILNTKVVIENKEFKRIDVLHKDYSKCERKI